MADADDERSRTPPTTIVAGVLRADAGYRGGRPGGTRGWVLLQTRVGAGWIDGVPCRPGGTLVLCSPGTPLTYRAEPTAGGWEAAWAHFTPRPHWAPLMAWPTLDATAGVMGLDCSADPALCERIAGRLEDVVRFSVSPYVHRETLCANALEEVLLWCDTLNPRGDDANAKTDPRVIAASEWLCRHLDRPVTLERLAEAMGMSVSRMAHLFRDQMGVPPLAYLEQQRMRRARDLLGVTGMTIRQIAAEVGFENAFYFATRFRRAHGVTPAVYRERLGITDLPPDADASTVAEASESETSSIDEGSADGVVSPAR